MESIFQSSKGLLHINSFRKKGSSYVFDRDLNRPLVFFGGKTLFTVNEKVTFLSFCNIF